MVVVVVVFLGLVPSPPSPSSIVFCYFATGVWKGEREGWGPREDAGARMCCRRRKISVVVAGEDGWLGFFFSWNCEWATFNANLFVLKFKKKDFFYPILCNFSSHRHKKSQTDAFARGTLRRGREGGRGERQWERERERFIQCGPRVTHAMLKVFAVA